jgi:hypothetical protein
MSLTIQATSTGISGSHALTVTFSNDGSFGPTSNEFHSQLTGHVVSGTGQPVIFSTYANTTLLTTFGPLLGPDYDGSSTIAPGNLNGYSLTEVLTIQGGGSASYSVDGILTVTNVYTGSLPVLTVMHSRTNVVLSWPTNAVGFTLKSMTSLVSSAVWTNVSPAPVIVNTNNVVTNSISGARRFYRLSQ